MGKGWPGFMLCYAHILNFRFAKSLSLAGNLPDSAEVVGSR